MIEPLTISVELDCSAEHAWRTWTERFHAWWPADHTPSGDSEVEVVFQPRLGGRIFERAPDGREVDWGEVTRWDPHTRLGYLWHIHADRSDATDVELTFVDVGNERSRVDIVHTGWERLGARGAARRDANQNGWGGLLPHFAAAANDSDATIEGEIA